MTDNVAVVVGAHGAIGAAWLQQLAQSGDYRSILALARNSTGGRDGNIVWHDFNYQAENSLAAASALAADLGQIRQVIVTTGILQDDQLRPEKSWRALDAEALAHYFLINSIGPALVAKYFLPRLPRDMRAVFAVLSARVGSISDNHLGGWYGYRASKAALNQLIRTSALELARTHPQALCVSLHPGTVDSGLSQPFQRGIAREKIFAPEQAARQLQQVIDGLHPKDSGGFFAWDGSAIGY